MISVQRLQGKRKGKKNNLLHSNTSISRIIVNLFHIKYLQLKTSSSHGYDFVAYMCMSWYIMS